MNAIKLYDSGVFLRKGQLPISEKEAVEKYQFKKEEKRKNTISWRILQSHNTGKDEEKLKIKFDSITSHDLTYVGIIQTAKASGMKRFPIPYVMTCCHNSLAAVGGTINEDDHIYGLSAAKKYGGIYVPPHIGVIHQYMREMHAGCGKMILGSDSHTRYGALGTMAVGEGGGELVKQILEQTWDISYPEVIAVYLDNKPGRGIGPQDIAIALISAVFANGYVKNKVLEFVGPGVSSLSTDFRNGIDVMTTETTCLTSIWMTDNDTKEYLRIHGREQEYQKLEPGEGAYYDGCIYIDLAKIHSMIALPFHPSNGVEIRTLNENLEDILHEVEEEAKKIIQQPDTSFDLKGKIRNHALYADQAVIAGCAGGTYSNLMETAHLLDGNSAGNAGFQMSIYPGSQAVMMELIRNGAIEKMIAAGAIVRSAFCGPCFGAGDTPMNAGLSIRHTTRNFPNREGSKPGNGQISGVALMDARSVAVSAVNGGKITAADEWEYEFTCPEYLFDNQIYEKKVYQGFGKQKVEEELIYGPNIKEWPELPELKRHMLLKVCAFITDPVTTTDELIPSGETASYRSNPLKLADYTLSRRVPEYVKNAKHVMRLAKELENGTVSSEITEVIESIRKIKEYESINIEEIGLSSTIYARRPGDGSAREQAASCQRVLLGGANLAEEYATKRYRSNLINWGILPFLVKREDICFSENDYLFIPEINRIVECGETVLKAYVISKEINEIELMLEPLTFEEKAIIQSGSLINYNRKRNEETGI